jgi:hypothetical protein
MREEIRSENQKELSPANASFSFDLGLIGGTAMVCQKDEPLIR